MPEVDVLAFETIPCLKEAGAIVRLLRTQGFGLPAWLSFSCRDACFLSRAGELFAPDAVSLACEAPTVVAVGLNCTPPSHVRSLLQVRAGMAEPLLASPCVIGKPGCCGRILSSINKYQLSKGLESTSFHSFSFRVLSFFYFKFFLSCFYF
jgi:methionine synthase I (cobalamin-dependent)